MKKLRNSGKQKRSPSDMVLHRTLRGSRAVPVASANQGLAHKLRSLSVTVTDITKGNSLQLLGLEKQDNGIWRIKKNLGKSTRCLRLTRGNGVATKEKPSSKFDDTCGSKDKRVRGKTENAISSKGGRDNLEEGDCGQIERKRTTRSMKAVIPEVVNLRSSDNDNEICLRGTSIRPIKKKVKHSEDVSESKTNKKMARPRNGHDMKISEGITLDSELRLRSNSSKSSNVLPNNGNVREKRSPPKMGSNKSVLSSVSVASSKKDLRKSQRATCPAAVKDNFSHTEVPVKESSGYLKWEGTLHLRGVELKNTKKARRLHKELKTTERNLKRAVPPANKPGKRKAVIISQKSRSKASGQEAANEPKIKGSDDEENDSDIWNVFGGSDGNGKLKISRKNMKICTKFQCSICGLELHSLLKKLEHEFTHIESRQLCVSIHRCILQSSSVKVPIYVSSEEVAALKNPQEDACSSVGSVDGRPLLSVEDVINHEEYNAYDSASSSDGEESCHVDQSLSTVDACNVESPRNDTCGADLSCAEGTSACTPEKVELCCPCSNVEGSKERSKKKSHTKMRLWNQPQICTSTRSGRVIKFTRRSMENMEQMACSKVLFSEEKNEYISDEAATKEAEDVSEKLCLPLDEYVEVVAMKGDSKDAADTSVMSSEISDVIELSTIDGETSQEVGVLATVEKEKNCTAKLSNVMDPIISGKADIDLPTVEEKVESQETDVKLNDALDAGMPDRSDVGMSSIKEKPNISGLNEELSDGLAIGGDEGKNSVSNLPNDVHPFDEFLGNNIAPEDRSSTQLTKEKSDEKIMPASVDHGTTLKVSTGQDDKMEEIRANDGDSKADDKDASNQSANELTLNGVVQENDASGIPESDLPGESDGAEGIPSCSIGVSLVDITNDDDGCKDVMQVDLANNDSSSSVPDVNIERSVSSEIDLVSLSGDEIESRLNTKEEGLEDISDGEWEDVNDSEMRGGDALDISGESPDVEMIEELENVALGKNINEEGQMDLEAEKATDVSDPTCAGETGEDFVEEEKMEETENENEMVAENGSDNKSDSLDGGDIVEREEMPVEVNMTEVAEDAEDGSMVGVTDSVADGGMAEVGGILGEEEEETGINDQEYNLEGEQDAKGLDPEENGLDKESVAKRLSSSGEECVHGDTSVGEVEDSSQGFVCSESKPPADRRELITMTENAEQTSSEHCNEKEKITGTCGNAIARVCEDAVDNVTGNLGFKVQNV